MKRYLLIVIVLISIFLISNYAHAVGIGVYADSGIGYIKWKYGDMYMGKYTFIKPLNYFIGGGLILDTCVSEDKLFNYRLNLGYNRLIQSHEIKMHQLTWVNTFGFGILRTELIRLWLGPQLGMGYEFVVYRAESQRDRQRLREGWPIMRPHKFNIVSIHLGLALGANFNFDHGISLAVEGGFKGGTHIIDELIGNGEDISDHRLKLVDFFYEGYVSFGIMFRINEQFSQVK